MASRPAGLPSFGSLDAVQTWILAALLADGKAASPRGQSTREQLAIGFELTDPRARRIWNPTRRWSGALAAGEFAWHVSGSDEISPIAHYAPRWRNFSDDGVRIRGSCYGHRIFHADGGRESQWSRLVATLRSDCQSRRAVLNVQQPYEETLSIASKDVPCVTSCQFLVRDDRVEAIVNMRSNDVIWGLPYDVFLFTMLQEMLAVEIGANLGSYRHFAGSMHLYERHAGWADRIVADQSADPLPMPPMPSLEGLDRFLEVEREIRATGASSVGLAPYWEELAAPLIEHAGRRPAGQFRKSRPEPLPV